MVRTSTNRVKVSNHVSVEQKPNGYWYAIIARNGKAPLERSLKTKNRDDAIERVRSTSIETLAAHNYANTLTQDVLTRLKAGKKVTLGQAFEDVLASAELEGKKMATIQSMSVAAWRFLRVEKLVDEPVSALELRHIDHFLNKVMIKQKISSRRRAAWAIETMCSAMFNAGLISHNPAARVTIKTEGVPQELLLPTERKPFTLDELDRIIAASEKGSFWWCAIQIVMQTGLRLSDVVSLQWASIRGDYLEVVTGKRGTLVKHEMTPTLRAVFATIERRAGEAYIFPDLVYKNQASPSYLSQQFRRLCLRVGVEDRSFHGLRHTYALKKDIEERSKVRKQLMDEIVADLALKETQKAMGHSSPESTQHYLNHPQPA